MIIDRINLYNFRNFKTKTINFHSGINILVGENGIGKTSIIESIFCLSNLKSPRTNRLQDLIKKNDSFFIVEGSFLKNQQKKLLKIKYNGNKANILWGEKEIKKRDMIHEIDTIIFEPDDLKLIKGEPSERREYLDLQLSQLIGKYYQLKKEYEKVLKQRNWLLKTIKYEKKSDDVFLDILTEKIIEKGAYIYNIRKSYIDNINQEIDNIFFDVSGLKKLQIKYKTTPNLENFNVEEIKTIFREEFKIIRNEEIEKAVTLLGPHRDDFLFYLNEENLKNFGSQGQQRLSVISLKLAEIKIFEKLKERRPILLLDDAFSELDVKKKNKLFKYIKSDDQTIITTTNINNIEKKLIKEAKQINLEIEEVPNEKV